MSRLMLLTLGALQVCLDDREITRFETDRARALLVYLAVEAHRPHRRDALINLFWPDVPEAQARLNLRKTLHRLRQAIADERVAPPFLLVTRQTIQFNPQSHYWLDVAELRATYDAAATHPQPDALLQRIIELYQGDFLAHALDLSEREFALLELLLRHPGRAFSRSYLTETLWAHAALEGERSVDNAVLRLRRKLGTMASMLETVRGHGYRWKRYDP